MKRDPDLGLWANEEHRTAPFRDNEKLDDLLAELRELLKPVQDKVNNRFEKPQWPVGLILGPPRSGTTVFLQFLAATGSFSYPTNLLTRFAYAPYIGALVQKMLFESEYDYQGDFHDIQSGINFRSDLGKSSGALAVNEFFHFWRGYLKKFFPEPFSHEELKNIDFEAMSSELASIEDVFGKPFCAKGMLQQFNLDVFFERQPFSFFFRIIRDPIYICQSLLISREKYFGDRQTWWSAKPEEYAQLKDMDVYHQVAGQVFFTEKAIETGLKLVPQKNQLTVEYEAFCENPTIIYKKIVKKYAVLGCELPSECKSPKSFKCTNEIRLSREDISGLRSAYSDFTSGSIVLD